ncbi:hypothetical protein J2810_004240 [Chryseobacterium rhizosphaerae]|uniref:alginate export family protein n=1 Tax=Chryseobacterium rhizosphaerae TaxID=395937 RepID=UPI002854F08A|nr:alginate export family protein [Chryseobacterium rhizosphaerae]MDR6548153.1 hypothetical protein [Chryseobacterium rhizosphaerae]
MKIKVCLSALLCIFLLGTLKAQDALLFTKSEFKPAFKNLNYEENYSALSDSTQRNTLWKKVKYIPLYKNSYLTFGGEVRARMEIRNHLNYGTPLEDHGANFQQRTRLWANWHIAKPLRFFTEIQGATSHGLDAPPSPVDQDQAEVHQAFLEYSDKLGDASNFNVRVGRQELAFGKFRLLDVRMPPNYRKSFDVIRAGFNVDMWRFDAIIGNEVRDVFGNFNDRTNENFKLIAGHVEKKFKKVLPNSSVEFMYMHTDRTVAPSRVFLGVRNSFSLRISGIEKGWNYDFEVIGQTGKSITGQSIRAWYVGSETNYTFPKSWKPYLGYRVDIASGDKNSTDNRNTSYDFLWSRGTSWVPDLGFTNLTIIGPTAGTKPFKRFAVDFWAQWLWRNSIHDGLYKMSAGSQRLATTGTAKYVGFRTLIKLEYQITPFLVVGTYMDRTFSGTFLKESPTNKDLFYNTTFMVFRF